MSRATSREARVDLFALRANIRGLLADRPDLIVDVTGDAYGHGAIEVATAALDEGARVAVRDERERARLRAAGFGGDPVTADDDARAQALEVYGLGSTGKPVMRCTAEVLSLKPIAAGEGVSYGYTWRASVDSILALVPLGYADGIHRSASNVGRVWCGGASRLVAGRVAMDALVLDLGQDYDVAATGPRELVTVFGDANRGHASARQWADSIGAHPLEVTSRIGTRVNRVWS